MKRKMALCLALLVAPVMAFGVVIIDDSFADGDRTSTGALDADWWSSNSTLANSIDMSVGSLGLVSGGSSRGVHATFASQHLEIGETINVTYAFTTPTTLGSKSGGLRFALVGNGGVTNNMAQDLFSSSTTPNPVYLGLPAWYKDVDVKVSSANDIGFRQNTETLTHAGRFLGNPVSSEWGSAGSSSDAGYTILANTDYTGLFSVERDNTNTYKLVYQLSNAGGVMDTHTKTDTSNTFNDYGAFGIWSTSDAFGSTNAVGLADNGIDITNFKVEVIPEPATFGLLGLGGVALVMTFRRRASKKG